MKSTIRLAAALLALAAIPQVAEAQFGGLRKRLEQKIGLAEGGERAPAFSDRVLEITDARLDQLVKGLRVEAGEAAAQERRDAAGRARDAERAKQDEAYAACSQPFAKELLRYTGMTMGLAFAAKREQDKSGKAGGPMQDSLKAVTDRMVKTKDAMVAKCGAEPPESSDSSFDAMAADEGRDPQALGARAAGLTADQYAVLRERAAAFVLARGGRTGSYVYAAGERASLEHRARELAPFRALLGG
ncbi:hypothetical protein [Roseisolibacter sp. H3M3-2]|uniref:hypothetical protein n=1 Tax=Roseisolibacter sp. H3M3-2 TaxID=3031323 RepID=UPI0023D9B405|nr:hypothetical protein [Roseisolibacter sp. H3M3-2]MDF1506069.1 hypothetical protein [Roseisolibacter sp. H3M3-2]